MPALRGRSFSTPAQRAAAGRGKRVQFNMLVSAETKRAIAELARDTGKPQSQIGEALLTKGLDFDRTLVAHEAKLHEVINKLNAIERRLFEPAGLANMFKALQDIVGTPRAVQPAPVGLNTVVTPEGIGSAAGAVRPAPASDEETARKLRDYEELKERVARLEVMMRSRQDEG